MRPTGATRPAPGRPGPAGRRVGRRLRGGEGFTLVEVLTAFTILAMLTLVVQRGFISARQGLTRAEARAEAERVAQALMDEPLGPEAVRLGRRSGTLYGSAWAMTLEPLDLKATAIEPSDPGPQAARTRWQPIRLTIQVAVAGAAPLTVETVRLAAGD